MGLFSKLFGSDKVVDAGISAIDKVWFTEEEKSDAHLMRAKLKQEYINLYHPYKLAQRIIMLIVCVAFVGIHVILVLEWMITIYMFWNQSEAYDFITKELLEIMKINIDALFMPFVLIIMFYFGTGEIDISKWLNIGKK